MKHTSFVTAVALLLFVVASAAVAQVATVSVVYEFDTMEMARDCPGAPPGSVIDTMWVVAQGFDMWVNAIEYMIEYPAAITWLGDIVSAGALSIGQSPTGIAVAYPMPANGYDPLPVQMVVFAWMCDSCAPTTWNSTIVVTGYPSSGKVRAVRWPDLVPVDAIGMTSTVCSLSPVRESTWGGIKGLYRE